MAQQILHSIGIRLFDVSRCRFKASLHESQFVPLLLFWKFVVVSDERLWSATSHLVYGETLQQSRERSSKARNFDRNTLELIAHSQLKNGN